MTAHEHHERDGRSAAAHRCPLCAARDGSHYHRDARRSYLRCAGCELIFVPPEARLDAASERARYQLHRNDPSDEGYRQFLSRLIAPLVETVPPGAEGLDFGCGPEPLLADMLSEQGRPCASYDPFFAPDLDAFERRYDFVTASEVLEHVFDPARELQRLFDVLRPRGVLAIMTGFAPASPDAFAAWHYIRDPTHVCFFSPAVFRHVGERWNATVTFAGPNVVLLHRRA